MSTMEGMEEAEAGWSLSGTGWITERSPEKETITRAFKLSAQEAFEHQILTCPEKTKSSNYSRVARGNFTLALSENRT